MSLLHCIRYASHRCAPAAAESFDAETVADVRLHLQAFCRSQRERVGNAGAFDGSVSPERGGRRSRAASSGAGPDASGGAGVDGGGVGGGVGGGGGLRVGLRRKAHDKVGDIMMAIALCHNVTPVHDDDAAAAEEADELLAVPALDPDEIVADTSASSSDGTGISYQASSPDEISLVKFRFVGLLGWFVGLVYVRLSLEVLREVVVLFSPLVAGLCLPVWVAIRW